MSERRAKRACTVRAQGPSSAHYVGYVEDDETPEAIMKKFEALERVQKQAQVAQKQQAGRPAGDEDMQAAEAPEAGGAGAQGEQVLTEEVLLEVFKQTSAFNVKTVQNNADYHEDEAFYSEDEWFEDFHDAQAFEEEDLASAEPRRRRALAPHPAPLGAAGAAAKESKAHKHILTAYNRDNQMLLRRKKVVDPYEVIQIKLPPPPLASSWGRSIKPYAPPEAVARELAAVPDSVHEAREVCGMDTTQLGTDFLGVLLNPPWHAHVTPTHLAALRLDRVCPLGFIFVWVEKEVLSEVMDVFAKASFQYVENLTWVQMTPANRLLEGNAPFIGRSHRTLLIFRRDRRLFPSAKLIELRHQRNPDVEAYIVCSGADGRLVTPDAAYVAIETLLPGGYTPGQPGKFLELWAHPEVRRPGWKHIVCAK